MPHLSSIQAAHLLTNPFKRHKQRYVINPPDEVHQVVYLGNVLTILAKGDQSIERPLAAIWRSYTTRKRDVPMKLTVTRSGLKVETKQLGVTEYWANRITYCHCPSDYGRIFCWVYKHEGKRMKPELRCHAVLCKKQSEPAQIVSTLTTYLKAALQEYRREKLTMEKARKNSASSGCPRRKLILQTGTLNFRPPVNRSKSAPRLGSIDEEDEGDADENHNVEEQDELTSMSDFEFDETSDLDSLNYRATPLLGDNRHHFPASSLTDDQLSQASTSSTSTASSTQKLPSSRSMESQLGSVLLEPPRHKLSAPPAIEDEDNADGEDLKVNEEDQEINGENKEDSYQASNFPHRQLSLSSASRRRLKPRPTLVKQEASELDREEEEVNLTPTTPPAIQLPADQLTTLIDSALILEEDELHAESLCSSSDDGFGSSCHETDSQQKRSQAESDYLLSDDSATEIEQKERKRKGQTGVEEAEHLHRMLMANQQVTAL